MKFQNVALLTLWQQFSNFRMYFYNEVPRNKYLGRLYFSLVLFFYLHINLKAIKINMEHTSIT